MAYNSFDIPDSWKGWIGQKDTQLKANTPTPDYATAPSYRDLPASNDKEARTVKSASLWRNRETNGGKKGSGWQFMPVTLGDIQLWEPIIRAVGRKTIIETPLVERSGTVKEIISSDDWIFNIRGIIKRPDGSYPDTEIAKLVALRSVQKAIPIISGLSSMLLDNEIVVINSLTFPETPGFTQSVAYEIECISDIPFELEVARTKSTVIVGDLTAG